MFRTQLKGLMTLRPVKVLLFDERRQIGLVDYIQRILTSGFTYLLTYLISNEAVRRAVQQ